MAYMNEFKILGNLGNNPEIKEANGELIAKLSLAVQRPVKDGNAEWYEITLFGKLAEYARDYLRKGDTVLVSGHLKKSNWMDKETGKPRQAIELIGNDVQGLLKKTSAAQTAQNVA